VPESNRLITRTCGFQSPPSGILTNSQLHIPCDELLAHVIAEAASKEPAGSEAAEAAAVLCVQLAFAPPAAHRKEPEVAEPRAAERVA